MCQLLSERAQRVCSARSSLCGASAPGSVAKGLDSIRLRKEPVWKARKALV